MSQRPNTSAAGSIAFEQHVNLVRYRTINASASQVRLGW